MLPWRHVHSACWRQRQYHNTPAGRKRRACACAQKTFSTGWACVLHPLQKWEPRWPQRGDGPSQETSHPTWLFCTLFREALWRLCCQYLQLMEKWRHRRQENYSVFHVKSGLEAISLHPWKNRQSLKEMRRQVEPLQVQNPSVLFGIGNNLNLVWDCLSVPGSIYKPYIILIILTAANAWIYIYVYSLRQCMM